MTQRQIQTLRTFIKNSKENSATKRAMAVLLLETGGDVTFTGYTRKHAERLRRSFSSNGVDTFKDHRKNNRDRVLTKAEREQIVKTLKTKQPRDVMSSSIDEHWSTYLLGEYIYELTGKRYKSKTSQYLLFREARFSFHLPGSVYENANEQTKTAWVKQTKPLLEQHWRDDNTVVLCGDEMVLTTRTTKQKIWLPKGELSPVIESNTHRQRKNFYGFLNLKTGQQHAYVTEKQNMFETAKILRKIRKLYSNRKIVLFWDNCGWHKGSAVADYIEQDGNIEVIWFPSYAPELNPQEHVWKEGRRAITHNAHITKLDETAQKFEEYITGRLFPYPLLGLRAELVQV